MDVTCVYHPGWQDLIGGVLLWAGFLAGAGISAVATYLLWQR